MPKYEVSYARVFSQVVEAASEEEAINKAEDNPHRYEEPWERPEPTAELLDDEDEDDA